MAVDHRQNNPILQALHTSAKLSENTTQKQMRGLKDYALASFFNGMRALDKPPDYDVARKRALDAYMTPEGKDAAITAATKNEGVTTSGDAATLAAVADKIATGARRIELQNYMAQIDDAQRNEMKRLYMMRNLGLISQMADNAHLAPVLFNEFSTPDTPIVHSSWVNTEDDDEGFAAWWQGQITIRWGVEQ